MKIIIVFLATVFFCTAHPVAADGLSGKQIIEIHKKRHMVKSAADEVVMLLVDESGNKKARTLRRFAKQFEDGLNRTLIVFKEPKDLEGTALMTWELGDGRHKQWMFLPGQAALQLIADRGKRSAFMGSDFTYEDLQPDTIEDYVYSDPRSESVDGADCHVIEILPATEEKKKESSYGKRLVWIRKDIFFTVKVEYYDRNNRHIKTQVNQGLVNVEGDTWFSEKVLMETLKTGHKTLMGVKKKQVNIPLEDGMFTEKYILSGRHAS
ncbi:MAG: outer membrane lipoprotein-sorting protein [Desulfobacteraceae bacterium]|nr:MAG: outer membrane lipoprotein-sorting protein [Desulfobacteraceae bacterium]